MAVTWLDVLCIAPELATVPPASQACLLADVLLELEPDSWGVKYDLAVKYLLAHRAAIFLRNQTGVSATGVLVEETVGQVSRKFANVTMSANHADDLDLTSYGQFFRRLLMGTLGCRGPLVT